MNIILDIGHTRGRIQPNKVDEHALAEKLAAILAPKLQHAGHNVQIVDFPSLSNGADLTKTAAAINAATPDFSISLHADWASLAQNYWGTNEDGERVQKVRYVQNPAPSGGHVCYWPASAKGKQLAAALAAPLAELLPGRADKTVPRGDLYILRATKCPAVLVECGFMSNPHDLDILQNTPEKIATALARGVAEYERSRA